MACYFDASKTGVQIFICVTYIIALRARCRTAIETCLETDRN